MARDSNNIRFNDLNRKAFTNGTQRFQEGMRMQSNNFWTQNRGVTPPETPLPNTIADLILWYDFSDESTYTYGEGDAIGDITDKSGMDNTGISIGFTTIDRTFVKFPLNCAYAFDFTLTNSFAIEGKTVFVTAYTDFSGVGGGFAAQVYLNDNTNISATGHMLGVITSGSDGRMQVYDGTFGAYDTLGSIHGPRPSHTFVYQTINPTANFVFRQDGILMPANLIANGNFSLTATQVGAYGANPSYPQGPNSRIGDLLVYDRILNSTEIAAMEAYLKLKWDTL